MRGIPEHVRQQAMDAVAHKETTAQIRMYRNNDAPAPESSGPTQGTPSYNKITPEMRKQAMDAVAHTETKAQVQLMKETGAVTSPHTPTRSSLAVAERVADLHKSGQNIDSIHRNITKDNFGRDHG